MSSSPSPSPSWKWPFALFYIQPVVRDCGNLAINHKNVPQTRLAPIWLVLVLIWLVLILGVGRSFCTAPEVLLMHNCDFGTLCKVLLDKCVQGLSFQLYVFLAKHRHICTDLVTSGQPDKCSRGGLVPAAVIVACRRPAAFRTILQQQKYM